MGFVSNVWAAMTDGPMLWKAYRVPIITLTILGVAMAAAQIGRLLT